MKKFVFALILLMVNGQWSIVNGQEMQLPPIPVDPAVRIGHLDNGLTYYIRHNEKPEKRVEFYIAQKVGSTAWFGSLPGTHGLQRHEELPWQREG